MKYAILTVYESHVTFIVVIMNTVQLTFTIHKMFSSLIVRFTITRQVATSPGSHIKEVPVAFPLATIVSLLP